MITISKYTCPYAQAHKHSHVHAYTLTHRNKCIHKHMYTRTHICTRIHTYTYTHVHAHLTHIVLSMTMPKYSNRTVSNICSNSECVMIMLVITSSTCGKYIHFNNYPIVIHVKILLHCPVHIPGSMVTLSIVIIVIHDSKQLIM